MELINLKKPGEKLLFAACGLVLGNFDGVHRGHRALIEELKRLNAARKAPLPLGAFCFRTPPSHELGDPVPQLTTTKEKLALLRRAGLQFVYLCDFPAVRNLSPEQFAKEILAWECRCQLAVCGFNYTFGKHGKGRAEDLARYLGTEPDTTVSIVPPVTDGRHTVSSTVIRSMLEQGHPEDATRLLGRPFMLTGTVERGRQVGRTLGFPTANLAFPPGALIPAHGVYAITARVGKRSYCGIANVGVRPTYELDERALCESFLFDFNGDLYGKQVQISFLHFLRAERAFPSEQALQAQIQNDITRALEYF